MVVDIIVERREAFLIESELAHLSCMRREFCVVKRRRKAGIQIDDALNNGVGTPINAF